MSGAAVGNKLAPAAVRRARRGWVRSLFLLPAFVSLGAFVAAGVLRYRDRGGGETFLFHVERTTPDVTFTFVQVWSSGGSIRVAAGRFRSGPPMGSETRRPFYEHSQYTPGPRATPIERNVDPAYDRVIGGERFQYYRSDLANGPTGHWVRSVCAPAWFWLLATGAAAALVGARVIRRAGKARRTRRRVRAGLCVGCGYDLRSSDGRCPECGALKA